MQIIKRLLTISVIFCVLVITLIGGVVIRLVSSVPNYEGRYSVTSGLKKTTKVVRDRVGVPHIYAQDRKDAYFALGYVHAQDRLWQMHISRMHVSGRLAEIYGAMALPHDVEMRTLGYAERARISFSKLPADTREQLEVYAEGVNAYLESDAYRLPPEFILTQTSPHKWSAVDCMFILYSFWSVLSTNRGLEIEWAQVAHAVGSTVADNLFRPYLKSERVALSIDDLVKTMGPDIRKSISSTAATSSVSGRSMDAVQHSNNWVVGAERSISQAPLLANDPHLGLNIPSIWYFAHLRYGEEEVIGATVAGVPGVAIGRNRALAWGFTASVIDTEDLYLERLHPTNASKYKTPSGWTEFAVRDEVFKVRFEESQTVSVKSSRHGPILPPRLHKMPVDTNAFEVALSAPFNWIEDTTIKFFWGLNEAKNWDEVVELSQYYNSVPQNLVVATTSGDIGYIMLGPPPLRSKSHEAQGRRPVQGEESKNDWLGIVPVEERPRVKNPLSGYIVTANDKITPDSFKHSLNLTWSDSGRGRRVEELLKGREQHDLDSFSKIQMDIGSARVRETLPYLLKTKPSSPRDERALQLLSDWDGRYKAEAPQPAIYVAFMGALTDAIYEDELDSVFAMVRGRRPEIVRDAFGGILDWCDNTWTFDKKESCEDLLAPSLKIAMDGLTEVYGEDMTQWRWAEQSAMVHSHLGLSFVPWLNTVLSRQTPGRGGPSSPNVGYYKTSELPRISGRSYGASMRFLVDMGDLEGARFVLSTGQSGHFWSRHYDDLQKLWVKGRYIRIPTQLNSDEIEATLVLEPVSSTSSTAKSP